MRDVVVRPEHEHIFLAGMPMEIQEHLYIVGAGYPFYQILDEMDLGEDELVLAFGLTD